MESMTEAQRAQYLITHCCGGNATDFAKSIGIEKARMSRIVHGQLRLNRLYDRIMTVYPEVNPRWLSTGEGYPGDISTELVKQRLTRIIEEKEALIRTLQRVIEEKL